MKRHESITENRVRAAIDREPGLVRSTLDLPSSMNRNFWNSIPENLKTAYLELHLQHRKWPMILMSDYMRFSRDGNRSAFEELYFERRRMLSQMVLSYCIKPGTVMLKRIVDGIFLILGETSWCLPPHNSYIRDSRQYAVPDTSRPVVDLFAAETAAILSVTAHILRKPLNRMDKNILLAVYNAIYERVFSPCLRFHFWWMGNGLEPMCNWTPWITQNILLAVFASPLTLEDAFSTGHREEDRAFAERLKARMDPNNPARTYSNRSMTSAQLREKIPSENGLIDPQDWNPTVRLMSEQNRRDLLIYTSRSIDFFLDEYATDGCCDEGAQYYGHAGLCLFGCLDIYRQLLGKDAMEPVFLHPKVRNIADYIAKVHVAGPYYINFSDCSPLAGNRGAREYLFGQYTKNSVLADFAAQDFRRQSLKERMNLSEENLWYHLLMLQEYRNMMEEEPDESTAEPDCFLESMGLMISRDEHFVLAARAGDNGDSHNHNDVGSFTLYKDGEPMLIDLGVGTYTRKTFSEERYDIWTMQSQYHNLPSFYVPDSHEIVQQKAGEHFGAKNVIYTHNESESQLTMELSDAYGDARIHSVQRTIRFRKHSGITLEDHYQSDLLPVLSFMTAETPEYEKETATVRIGGKLTLQFTNANDITIESIPVQDGRLRLAWPETVYRILVKSHPAGLCIEIH